MYVDARVAHWLLGSASLLTWLTLTRMVAAIASAAPEKASVLSRKANGMNGFFRSSRYGKC